MRGRLARNKPRDPARSTCRASAIRVGSTAGLGMNASVRAIKSRHPVPGRCHNAAASCHWHSAATIRAGQNQSPCSRTARFLADAPGRSSATRTKRHQVIVKLSRGNVIPGVAVAARANVGSSQDPEYSNAEDSRSPCGGHHCLRRSHWWETRVWQMVKRKPMPSSIPPRAL